MSEGNKKHERDEEESSKMSVAKKKKVVRRSDDEVVEMLESWRNHADINDSEVDKGGISFDSVEILGNVPPKEASANVINRRVYTVIYGKNKPYKKHKTFQYDGTLIVTGVSAALKDGEGQIVSRASEYKNNELEKLVEGSHLVVGDQLCEICDICTSNAQH